MQKSPDCCHRQNVRISRVFIAFTLPFPLHLLQRFFLNSFTTAGGFITSFFTSKAAVEQRALLAEVTHPVVAFIIAPQPDYSFVD